MGHRQRLILGRVDKWVNSLTASMVATATTQQCGDTDVEMQGGVKMDG
jgi:hypothetical protein